jgi:hypothetical protein
MIERESSAARPPGGIRIVIANGILATLLVTLPGCFTTWVLSGDNPLDGEEEYPELEADRREWSWSTRLFMLPFALALDLLTLPLQTDIWSDADDEDWDD